MKKILFILPSFNYGGTMTSFCSLLPSISEKYDIDIFAIENKGSHKEFISRYCNILGEDSISTQQSIKKRIKDFLFYFVRFIKRQLTHLGIDVSPFIFRRIAKRLSIKSYDFAIAYQELQPTLLCSYIIADFKVAWIHCMFSRLLMTNSSKKIDKMYESFDKIVCVSQTARKDMIKCRPQWNSKVVVINNIIDKDSIMLKASQFRAGYDMSYFNIVSVGRIDPVKRFSSIPRIARKIIDDGFKIRWYIVGGNAVNDEYTRLLANIYENKVEDIVFSLGKQDNPYPYIADADLFVHLSSSETSGYTIMEAKALDVPVVITDFLSATEFTEDKYDGLIVTLDDIPQAIEKVISDKELYASLKRGAYEKSMGMLKSSTEEFDKLVENIK
jgi:glycosyltransferase involved in cell wall biosynthesis